MPTTTARRAATGATALLLATTLTACAGGDEPAATATPTPTPTPLTASASPTPTPEPTVPAPEPGPEPGEAGADQAAFTPPGTELSLDGDAAGHVVTQIRTGEHDGYDRVVYELTGGEGSPGYRVGYVDQAVEDPSGQVRAVDGDAILQVWLVGTTYPVDGGPQEHRGDLHPEHDAVEHVVRPLTFEGMTQSFIGVDDRPRPFRVTVLQDPARVVVDVQDD